MRTLLLALALLLAFATGAVADKTLTYFTVVLTDVNAVLFERDASAPNGWRIIARGVSRASVGAGYPVSITANASAGQRTTIETFITGQVLPALNAQEGL